PAEGERGGAAGPCYLPVIRRGIGWIGDPNLLLAEAERPGELLSREAATAVVRIRGRRRPVDDVLVHHDDDEAGQVRPAARERAVRRPQAAPPRGAEQEAAGAPLPPGPPAL